jgi:hypothetical protein
MRDLLLDGALVQRGIVERYRLQDALSDLPSSTSPSSAELLTCLNMEIWIRSWSRIHHQDKCAVPTT